MVGFLLQRASLAASAASFSEISLMRHSRTLHGDGVAVVGA
uniref:Uncharacterized protein n=1 Tax=Arundo donax TaxID=35708 RepID=A0A0A9FQD9_ARUDO